MRTAIMCMLLMMQIPSPAHAEATPEAFTCPITKPVESVPEKSTSPFDEDASLHYEDGLWVTIPESGIIELSEEDVITFGPLTRWRSETVTWLREDGVEGFVNVTGQRLDAENDQSPQTPLSPQRQYVRVGPVTTGLAFPSEGCWEVVGTVEDASITWVVEVQFTELEASSECPETLPNTDDLMGLPKFPGDGKVYNCVRVFDETMATPQP